MKQSKDIKIGYFGFPRVNSSSACFFFLNRKPSYILRFLYRKFIEVITRPFTRFQIVPFFTSVYLGFLCRKVSVLGGK